MAQLDGERRRAMEGVLDTADVVLVTREEGEALTGESTSERIAEVFFRRAGEMPSEQEGGGSCLPKNPSKRAGWRNLGSPAVKRGYNSHPEMATTLPGQP